MDLAGRTAVVIGGGSGIGRGIALGLAAEGCRVAVADIDGASADAVVAELTASGAIAIADVADAASRESLEDLALRVCGRARPHRPVGLHCGRDRRPPSRRGDRGGLGLDRRVQPDGDRADGRRVPAVPPCRRHPHAHRLHVVDGRGCSRRARACRRLLQRPLHHDEACAHRLLRDVARRARARGDRRVGAVPGCRRGQPGPDVRPQSARPLRRRDGVPRCFRHAAGLDAR